jgi:hypothetical protein
LVSVCKGMLYGHPEYTGNHVSQSLFPECSSDQVRIGPKQSYAKFGRQRSSGNHDTLKAAAS